MDTESILEVIFFGGRNGIARPTCTSGFEDYQFCD
jgi:hypothetical protein